jgi:hypothetical protein
MKCPRVLIGALWPYDRFGSVAMRFEHALQAASGLAPAPGGLPLYPKSRRIYGSAQVEGAGQGVPQDYVRAHMWFKLAASGASDASTRKTSAKNRDLVASLMTPAQIAEAQQMASEWAQGHPSTR